MKIECKLKREGGTTVEMRDGTKIKFVPNETGAHVAEVASPKHVQALLAVPEGYRIFGADDDPDDDVTDPAQTAEGQSDDQPGDGDDQPEGDEGGDDDEIALEHMVLSDLQALYEQELGKKPHHKAGLASLIREIETHRSVAGN